MIPNACNSNINKLPHTLFCCKNLSREKLLPPLGTYPIMKTVIGNIVSVRESAVQSDLFVSKKNEAVTGVTALPCAKILTSLWLWMDLMTTKVTKKTEFLVIDFVIIQKKKE